MGKYVNFCTKSNIIAGILSAFFITVNTVSGSSVPYEYNEIQSKINADVNSAATLTEITRFFKPENLIQTEETWVISGAGNKNGKCFKNMNYSAVTVSRDGVMYLSVTITEKNLFTSQLENSSSLQYQQLSHAVEHKINSFFKNEFLLSSLVYAKVLQFRKGSIIADLKLEFDDKAREVKRIRKKRNAGSDSAAPSSTFIVPSQSYKITAETSTGILTTGVINNNRGSTTQVITTNGMSILHSTSLFSHSTRTTDYTANYRSLSTTGLSSRMRSSNVNLESPITISASNSVVVLSTKHSDEISTPSSYMEPTTQTTNETKINLSSSSSTPQSISSMITGSINQYSQSHTPSVTEINESLKSSTIFSTSVSLSGSHFTVSPSQTIKPQSTFASLPYLTSTIVESYSSPSSFLHPSYITTNGNSIVETSVVQTVLGSTVNMSHAPPLQSLYTKKHNFSSPSTMKQTQEVSNLSTSMIVTTSKFVSVGKSSVNMSNTHLTLLPSTKSHNFSSISNVDKTETVSNLSTSMILTTSKFVSNAYVGKSSSVNMSNSQSTFLPSTRSHNFSSLSIMNQTQEVSIVSTSVTSNKFINGGNSSVNMSKTPPPQIPFTRSRNISSLPTINPTQTVSNFSASVIVISSEFVNNLGKSSSVNMSNTQAPLLPSTRSHNFSSFSITNPTQTVSNFSQSKIVTTSKFVNVSQTPPPQSLSTRSHNFSSLSTTNHEKTGSVFSTSMIASTSTMPSSSMFLVRKNSSVYNTSTLVMSSTASRNLSTVAINNTGVFSTLATSTMPSSSMFLGKQNASVYNTSTLVMSSTASRNLSTVAINNTGVFSTFATSMMTSSSMFLGKQNSSIYNTSTLVMSSTASRNLSTAAINNTGVYSTFATSMITSSSMFLGGQNTSVYPYQHSISTVQSLELTNVSTSSPSAANETIPLVTTNRTSIPTASLSTTVPYTTNISSSSIYPTESSLLSKSINSTLLSTSPVLSSGATASMTNSSLVKIVPSLTHNYSSFFTSPATKSTIDVNTTLSLTSSPKRSTMSQFSSPILVSSTISNNVNVTGIVLSSFKSNASSVTSTLSSLPTRTVNASLSASSANSLALSSTYSVAKNYSITPTQVSNKTIQPSLSTNATVSASMSSFHIISSRTTVSNQTNQTSIISTTLVNIQNISTKAIQPTSVFSSTPVTSTIRVPVVESKQRIVECNVTIVNKVYTRQLSNSSSKQYTEMVKEIKPSLVLIFEDTPGFVDVDIRGFRNGSVITIFHIVLDSSSNVTTQELGNVITTATNATNLTISNINIEELCTSGFCSNHGTCTKISNTQLQCSCNSGYSGQRCSSQVTGSNNDDDDDFEEYWIAIGICIGLLVLIIILLIFLALRRRRKYYVTRESVMSIGRTSGDVFFNPAYGHSREYLAGKDESSNVVPLEVVYENSSSSFKKDTYQEPEFMSNKKPQDDDDEEEDIYKTQLLLFLKQNNLLKNSSEDTQKPSWASSRSSVSTADSDSGL